MTVVNYTFFLFIQLKQIKFYKKLYNLNLVMALPLNEIQS